MGNTVKIEDAFTIADPRPVALASFEDIGHHGAARWRRPPRGAAHPWEAQV